MTENEWTKSISVRLSEEISRYDLYCDTLVKVPYSQEISGYDKSWNPDYLEPTRFETDLLIYEKKDGKIIPRIIVEAKLGSITTHDAITYSYKAEKHKYITPHLRYGIMIGDREKYPLPGRLFRHGTNFDFVFSFVSTEPSDKEWMSFVEIIKDEVVFSRQIEEMLHESRSKDRKHYYMLEKKLVLKETNDDTRLESKFADVSEHDMDMLFLEEFASSQEFLKIFTEKTGIDDSKVVSVEASKTDPVLGESDMTVIVEKEGKKIGLLIEDKIDAIAMPDQCSRYMLRGEKGIKNGEYDEFHVFIIAPEKYLLENKEASLYPNQVSYEMIYDYFRSQSSARSSFKLQQIEQAIKKQKTGYQAIEDSKVTDFWRKYSEFQKKNYPGLYLLYDNGIKGSKATWPRFNTVLSKLYMYHKTEFGFVDLTFDGCGEKIVEIEKIMANAIGNYLDYGYTVRKTQKSAAVRLNVPVLDLHKSFEEQIESVTECFDSIQRMSDLVKRIDQQTALALFK